MARRQPPAPDVLARAGLLESALAAGGDRLPPDAVAHARAVLGRTSQRLRLSPETTIVALAGATGSGKSSLFNALAGIELSEVGPRRPTTGRPMACVWTADGADPLLDWLNVPRRHRTSRESVLDADREASLHGLVLLDLPDHDSTVVAHRDEVDRLVDLADMLVWVVDPQKYADAALHARYLKPKAGHDTVMIVVLNQIDTLPPDAVGTCARDLRRLLDADGLQSVRILTASATRGDGVEQLRAVVAEAVRDQRVVVDRAVADMDAAARSLEKGVAALEADPANLPGADDLVGALSSAAGVPVVLDAVVADYRRRGAAVVGWPFTRWAVRLRPDPLRRLRLGEAEKDLRRITRSSLPEATPAQRARVELALRAVTSSSAGSLPLRWGDAMREAVTPPGADLADSLDAAIVGVDLVLREPLWWRAVGAAQQVLAGAAVLGFLWLAGISIVQWLGLPAVGSPHVGSVQLPTLLLLGGLGLGLLTAAAARGLLQMGAGRRRARVERELSMALMDVARDRVIGPVVEVLTAHRATREALAGLG